jgi:hypothetical protein
MCMRIMVWICFQASNERILLKPHMKLVFEIRDLK